MRSPPTSARSEAAFTLVELLLASTLGALLLTSVAMTTFTFTQNLMHLEEKAGITDGVDSVLGRMMRDVREAWGVEAVNDEHIKLTAPDGDVTEYYFADEELFVKRPNGDSGALLSDVQDVSFDYSMTTRHREADPVSMDAAWYSAPMPASSAIAYAVDAGSKLAVGFVVPAVDGGLMGGSGSEQVLSASASTLSIPVAWSGSAAESLVLSLYESAGPGSARPSGSMLASMSLPASSIPAAVSAESGFAAPAANIAIGLSGFGQALVPGAGYVLVLNSSGTAKMVVKEHPGTTAGLHDVALKVGSGSWTKLAMGIPFSLSGASQKTATAAQDVVSRVTVTIVPDGRPIQARSAALLSQALSDDPWLGVSPGDMAP